MDKFTGFLVFSGQLRKVGKFLLTLFLILVGIAISTALVVITLGREDANTISVVFVSLILTVDVVLFIVYAVKLLRVFRFPKEWLRVISKPPFIKTNWGFKLFIRSKERYLNSHKAKLKVFKHYYCEVSGMIIVL